ncbi:MAG: protein kinase domain-containing protein [Planctomycetota bacterium]
MLRYRLPDGSIKGMTFEPDQSLSLGRDADKADVAINDKQLSRCHCLVRRQGEILLLEDSASSNGTWLNGDRIGAAVELVDGDVITIGSIQLFVEQEPHDEGDPLVGRKLGDFEILGVLGRGSCGVVYRGLQSTLARPVAIKVLKPEWAKNHKRRQAFLSEARNAGLLNHPNLIQVHDVVTAEGHEFMVMEYAQGGSVDVILAEDGPLELVEVLRILADMGRALAYAHAKGLIHRDVKPANILIAGDLYKLADLGIAARIDEQGAVQQKRFAGSPSYLAPEQACGKPLDGRADIYALGASVWHLLTGKPIYSGTAREVIQQQVEAPVPDLRRLVPNVPGPLLSLLNRMLAKAVVERIAEAQLVADIAQRALDQQLAIGGIGGGGPAAGTSGRRPVRRRRGRRPSARRVAGGARRRSRRRRS